MKKGLMIKNEEESIDNKITNTNEMYLMEGTKAKVVCLENCVEYVRKYLDDEVEVTCISTD